MAELRGRILKYFKSNPGSIFILGFISALLVSMSMLIVGNPGVANEAAIYGFYLLIIGVTLQLYVTIRESRIKEEQSK